ncbi:MAG: hypothetical protein K0R57_6041 [Paenibacillaceae bacterium]|jgi:hypothetical protein|nr:hypothetical protein [Paenibacillaceae bacterium]
MPKLAKEEAVSFDYAGQRERRKHIFDVYSSCHDTLFNEDGDYIGPDKGRYMPPVNYVHMCLPYFAAGNPDAIRKANAVIRKLSLQECHFMPNRSLWLLRDYPHLLDGDVKQKLTDYCREHLDDFTGVDHDFVGVNDNFPCISAYTLMAGSLLFNRPGLYARGAERLHQLKEMLTRRGAASEYSSPTYSLLQLHTLAMLAELTEHDRELHTLILGCEERIWVDYLAHYFLPAGRLAGPYSRSYTETLTRWSSHPGALYVLLGERVQLRGFSGQEWNGHLAVHNHYLLTQDFHCPAYIRDWVASRSYPFAYEATTEYNSSSDKVISVQKLWSDPNSEDGEAEHDEYASGSGTISTYMTEEYSLGVASREWHCGSQTDTFVALYTAQNPIRGRKDVRMIYARYSVNDRLPGQMNEYPELGTRNSPYLFWDQGRKLGVHHERAAMMVYKPRMYARKQASSLRLMLVMPLENGEPEEIWLGDRRVEEMTGESRELCPVYLKDGHTYLAFFPLVPVNHGRQRAVRVERANDYLLLSFYNYEGAPRSFGKKEFALTGNGFVCEIGSRAEYGSFEAFRGIVGQNRIYDEYLSNTHMRDTTVRKSVYTRQGVELACEYSPVSEGIRYMTANGRVIGETKLRVDGLDEAALPFMGGGEKR